MREYYEVSSFDTYHDSVDGDRVYWIPSAECPLCKEGVQPCGLAYPWIEPETVFGIESLDQLRKASCDECAWTDYLGYAADLRKVLGDDLPITPGVGLGTYAGRVSGKIRDMEMPLPYELFLRRWVVEALRKEGFELRQFDISLKGKKGEDLVEIWLPPIGLAANVTLCPKCGRSGGKQYSRTVVAASVPDTAHCFLIRNEPGYAVFSREFVDALKRLKVKGVRFDNLAVV
ncbi:MAG TPA: double-CXXCG motif protein [Verrucomicrobiae bacterium]